MWTIHDLQSVFTICLIDLMNNSRFFMKLPGLNRVFRRKAGKRISTSPASEVFQHVMDSRLVAAVAEALDPIGLGARVESVYGTLCFFVVLYGLLWFYIFFGGFKRFYMFFGGFICFLYGSIWFYRFFCDFICFYMVLYSLYGFICSNLGNKSQTKTIRIDLLLLFCLEGLDWETTS